MSAPRVTVGTCIACLATDVGVCVKVCICAGCTRAANASFAIATRELVEAAEAAGKGPETRPEPPPTKGA